MIKKLLLLLTFTAVSLMAMNFQTASKEELMSIKGIGEKRAAAIMKYRKTHKIKSAADLKNIDGIGAEIADNAKRGIKNADKKISKAKKSTTRAKKATSKTKSLKEKTKTTKRAKKVAGDKTKRAEKKAKKSLKKRKEKAKKSKKKKKKN
jgi:competence protein ComEA